MSWKPFLKGYLTYSRKERTAIISMAFIILIIYLIPSYLSIFSKPGIVVVDTSLLRQLQEQQEEPDTEKTDLAFSDYSPQPAGRKAELFSFDPNTASVEDLQRLGLSGKTALTIEKYRNKGGRFRRPEDMQKIWGLPPGFYDRVKDHIVISQPSEKTYDNTRQYDHPDRQRKEMKIISVNEADSTAFESLPGIGPRLASRIILFREKLGGFYSADQVGETYGLPDSTFQKIKGRIGVDSASIRKIDVNTATADEMRMHPYIRWNLANAIVAYRNQHGQFQSVEQLRKIAVMDDRSFEKLKPYLKVQ